MKHQYWQDIGSDWLPIDQKYFETILVDFMGRPGGLVAFMDIIYK